MHEQIKVQSCETEFEKRGKLEWTEIEKRENNKHDGITYSKINKKSTIMEIKGEKMLNFRQQTLMHFHIACWSL